MNLNEIIDDFRMKEELRSAEFWKKQEEIIKKREDFKYQVHWDSFLPATTQEYKEWLKGYLEAGNKPTHYYNYPMNRSSFFIAKKDFELYPLFGASSIQIIIPKGINYTNKGLGHSTLYLMDGYRLFGNFVPIYSDIHF